MMKGIKLITVLFFVMFCAGTLYAQTSSQNDNNDSVVEKDDDSSAKSDEGKSNNSQPKKTPRTDFDSLPRVSIFAGFTEYVSADAGFELISERDFFCLYAQGEIGTDFEGVNFRLAAGAGWEVLDFFGFQLGGGVEFSPNKEPVAFGELTARLLFFQAKWIMASPNNGDYYETKFNFGISITPIIEYGL